MSIWSWVHMRLQRAGPARGASPCVAPPPSEVYVTWLYKLSSGPSSWQKQHRYPYGPWRVTFTQKLFSNGPRRLAFTPPASPTELYWVLRNIKHVWVTTRWGLPGVCGGRWWVLFGGIVLTTLACANGQRVQRKLVGWLCFGSSNVWN